MDIHEKEYVTVKYSATVSAKYSGEMLMPKEIWEACDNEMYLWGDEAEIFLKENLALDNPGAIDFEFSDVEIDSAQLSSSEQATTGPSNKEKEKRTMLKNKINEIVITAHDASRKAGWWTGANLNDHQTVPTKLCLIHSEISEAMEGHRKDLMDNKLPHRKMVEVELADALIRIADLAGAMGMDLGGAVVEKMAYNIQRADHKHENRVVKGGKSY